MYLNSDSVPYSLYLHKLLFLPGGLRPKNLEEKQYEIGFYICTKYWGKGYAFEAADAVIDYSFNKLNVSSLFAGHNPQNKASQHLLLKLGFIYPR